MLVNKSYILLYISFIFFNISINAQKRDLRFLYYTTDQGLSQNMVDCILKDSKGFLWFGTWNGLNRFDGYKFTVYKQNNSTGSISNNFIYTLCEDKFNNIWIGTNDGLNLYIYKEDCFVTYKYNSDTSFISSNHINSLLCDYYGNLWIASDKGINVCSVIDNSGNIKKIKDINSQIRSLDIAENQILTLFEDNNHNIWIGTANGMFLYNSKEKTFKSNPLFLDSLFNYQVQTVFRDNSSLLWIGTNAGLFKFNEKTRLLTPYMYNPDNNRSIIHDNIMSITQDIENDILIGSLGGLSIYNPETDDFDNYNNHINNSTTLNNEFINCIHADPEGTVWIGTERGGVNKFSVNQKKFEHFKHEPAKQNSLSHNTVNSIFEDDNNIYIGTAGGGLNIYDKNKQRYTCYIADPHNQGSISGNFITNIFRDSKNQLWIGTWGNGLNKLTHENKSNSIFIHYEYSPFNPATIIDGRISSILEDKNGNLWLGTKSGLDLFNPETGKAKHFLNKAGNPPISQVGCLQFDQWNNLWVGCINGLFRIYADKNGIIDINNSKVEFYENNKKDKNSISGNYILSILMTKDGKLWFGTYGNGLNMLIPDSDDRIKHEFIHYSEHNGLSNNVIYGIEEDNNGNLWLSTDNGLSKFNPQKKTFRNYYVGDGLLSNQFYWSSHYKNDYGKLYFGCMEGLNVFVPDSIKDNNYPPRVVITDFKIHNRSVKPGKKYNDIVVLNKAVTMVDNIVVSYKAKEFSFEFSALHYDQPEMNKYEYMLKGFDKNWKRVEADRRYASYTNIQGGNYVFLVRASNNDGQWCNKPVSIKIRVIPPFWVTWWFTTILVTALLLTICAYIRYKTYKLGKQKQILEVLVKKRTAKIEEQKEELAAQAEHLKESNTQLEKRKQQVEGQKQQLELQNHEILVQRDKLVELNNKVQEANQQQLRFFTHISHEFRTPLTLIISPVEQMLKEFANNNRLCKRLMLINKNAQRLLHLINQLMEVRKIETGRVELKTSKDDIIKFVENISQSFVSLANQRLIRFDIKTRMESINIFFDKDKLENILYNLLSNAFKYTPVDGHVNIEIFLSKGNISENEIAIVEKNDNIQHQINQYVEIKISDTGIGIARKTITDIFLRFYRITSVHTQNVRGTGIGLYLTREMVKAHKGQLIVKSLQGKGSCFRVLIPADDAYLSPDEKTNHITYSISGKQNIQVKLLAGQNKEEQEHSAAIAIRENKQNAGNSMLLIVDDDRDLCSFIADSLKHLYKIITAENGDIGLQKAIRYSPDLIISDIMMPEMDGLEFCSHIKTNINTSHIPVILLTAKAEVNHYIEGLDTGADDYITKPFNIDILQAKIKSILYNREKLRKQFATNLIPNPREVTTTRSDEVFLKKIIQLVESNLSDPEFGVQGLASKMCISRSLLHKKLNAVIDQSPNDFITSTRLKKAVILLLKGEANITEVAFDVGFNDPKYFSRCFKKHFGKSPTEYIREKTS